MCALTPNADSRIGPDADARLEYWKELLRIRLETESERQEENNLGIERSFIGCIHAFQFPGGVFGTIVRP